MRRLVSVLVLSLALGCTAAGAHPGHGQFVSVDVGGFAFAPSTARLTAGEEVLWRWPGPDRQHTVTADPGQAESFDSDPGRVPGPAGRPAEEGFSHQFTRPGTYTYFCKVHSTMRGTVVVDERPPFDPAPVVAGLRAPGRVRTKMTLSFSLSEGAVVLVEIDRVRRGVAAGLVLSRSRQLGPGPARLPISVRSLRAGTYRVQVVGVDAAGNAGPPARATVRVVRSPRSRTRGAGG